MKKILTLIFVLATLTTNSCSKAPKYLAPKDIRGYIFSFYAEKVKGLDEEYKDKISYYEFNEDESYSFSFKGEVVEAGSYSYRRSSPNSSSLLLSYSYQNQLFDYLIVLNFTSPCCGNWNSSYDNDGLFIEGGTFKVLRHGFR
ncbi:MAG: hypothetical protein S4CHLAM6_11290 [Chlamydiae bacterium]|nr:hypothetical protein [Chlamydiota bacterium]